jgi:hypothetical protein
VVSHPGPRPQAIELPDAQIRLAIQRVEELLGELDRLAAAHDDVLVVNRMDLGGASGDAYRSNLGLLLTDLGDQRGVLRGQLEELRTGLAHGQAIRTARADAIARWEHRMAAYRDYQADLAGNQPQ